MPLRRKEKALQTTVAALLLLTSTVVFACVVVTYAISIAEATINTDNFPAMGQLKELQQSLLNQTNDLYSNQTSPALPSG
jgi:hypothetical protein